MTPNPRLAGLGSFQSGTGMSPPVPSDAQRRTSAEQGNLKRAMVGPTHRADLKLRRF